MWGSSSLDLLGQLWKDASNIQASILFGVGQLFPHVNLCLNGERLLMSAMTFLQYRVEGLSHPDSQTLKRNVLHGGSHS